tara:strand:- start:172 stop:543 length:372 start_codon:yes stop_codon:yes gene_type:complete
LVEITEILPIFYVLIPCICLVAFYKIRTGLTIEKTKQKNKSMKHEQTFEGTIDKLIDNAPANLKQIDSEIATLRAKGCTDDQLKRLEQERSLLEYATKYGEIVKPIAKPLSKVLGKFIGGLGN